MAEVLEKAVSAPINITTSAMEQLKRILKEQNVPEGYGLRVGVKVEVVQDSRTYLVLIQKKKQTSLLQ